MICNDHKRMSLEIEGLRCASDAIIAQTLDRHFTAMFLWFCARKYQWLADDLDPTPRVYDEEIQGVWTREVTP